MKKPFICFEGIDGSGKSTQLTLLAEFLASKEADKEVVQTREPYDEAIADLLHQQGAELTPLAQFFLFSASRAQQYERVILPALARGAFVLSDRTPDSSLAYQGYGLGLDLSLIKQQNKLATQGQEPDIIFLMDIEPALMFERLRERGKDLSSYEKLGEDFFARVCAGYRELAKAKPNYHLLKADQSPDKIAAQIQSLLQ